MDGSPGSADGMGDVRATVAATAAAIAVPLESVDGAWSVRGVPLAPFPARLRIDVEQQVLWHDVVAAEVVPPTAVEAAVEGIPLPRPEVRMMIGEAQWMVAISYPLPRPNVTTSEVTGLLGAGALYASALAVELGGHLSRRWRARLEEFRFVAGSGFPHDPRDLLRGRVVPWPDVGQ